MNQALSDRLTDAILDASREVILILDGRGRIIRLNASAEKILGCRPVEMRGKTVFDLIQGGTLHADLKRLLAGGDGAFEGQFLGHRHERTVRTPTGQEIPVSVHPNRIAMGTEVVYPLYIGDLTHEKAAQLVLERSREQMIMNSKMSSLGEMAGGVAHEINTPLGVILMRTEMMIEGLKAANPDLEALRTSLRSIELTVQRISDIVRGLRSFARDGRTDPLARHPLRKIIEDAFSLCQEKFTANGVRLDYACADDVEIECRPAEIAQVLLNFLSNSYDGVQPLPQKWVRVDVDADIAGVVILSVTDSGGGIPADVQKKMMQPFFTTKDVGKGTGLGLSVSKGIVESHGGRIEVDNACSNTRITVLLPRAS